MTHDRFDVTSFDSATLPADIQDALQAYAGRLTMFHGAIQWLTETPSTNDVAQALAEHGAAEGTVVGADAQTAGRGRLGRQWSSPPGAGLYVSVVLRPAAPVIPLVTIAAGVAIAEGIREATGLDAALKWPNDVYLGGRKVAGILAEAGSGSPGVQHVVLGFGINVSPAAHPPDVSGRATSLEREVSRPVDRGLVLACCLAALATRYQQVGSYPAAVLTAWRALAATLLRRPVECTVGSRAVTGIAEDIDDRGALIVRVGTETVRVISGEVLWR